MEVTINDKKSDIITAQKIVSGDFNMSSKENFYRNSGIYNFTNEVITDPIYKSEITNKKKILSVIGSGDQILNSILLGSTDITGFDISRFPKYYLLLKIAAIKGLNKEEFVNFFASTKTEEEMDSIFDKIVEHLDPISLNFWKSLYDYFEYYEVSSSMLFTSSYIDSRTATAFNPYLHDDRAYDELKEKLQDVKLNLIEGNIYSLVRHKKFKKPFDLAIVSNILGYNKLKENMELLEKIPLTDDAKILGYMFYWTLGKDKENEKKEVEKALTNDNVTTTLSDITLTNGTGLILTKRKRK